MRTHRATGLLFASFAFTVVASVLACGQVTGLSDDYTFDLEGGGVDAGDDAASGDAIADDAPGPTNRCPSQRAENVLSRYNGSAACKTCLDDTCCDETVTCAAVTACDDELSCRLGCTVRNPNNRASCFAGCPRTPAPYAIETCSQKCTTECGFPAR